MADTVRSTFIAMLIATLTVLTGPVRTGVDCNGNGIADVADIAAGTSEDCNANGVPDECELSRTLVVARDNLDADSASISDLIPDRFDFTGGTSGDADFCGNVNNNIDDGGSDMYDCGVGDVDDNCPFDVNAGQEDVDGDSLGDVCDPDDDGDGIDDAVDNCAVIANAGQEDGDADSVGDACDICPTGDDTADADAGVTPEDVRLHEFDEEADPPMWIPAGNNNVGRSVPTGVVGDCGYFESPGQVTFWCVRDHLSTFAVGAALPQVAEIPAEPQEPPSGDVTPPEEPGTTVTPDEPTTDGNTDVVVNQPLPPPADNADNTVDEPAPEQPTPPTTTAPPACGAGAAPCGLMGFVSWSMLLAGFAGLKTAARR